MGKASRHMSSSFEVQETIFAEPKDVENIKKDRRYFQLASKSQVCAKFDREL